MKGNRTSLVVLKLLPLTIAPTRPISPRKSQRIYTNLTRVVLAMAGRGGSGPLDPRAYRVLIDTCCAQLSRINYRSTG